MCNFGALKIYMKEYTHIHKTLKIMKTFRLPLLILALLSMLSTKSFAYNPDAAVTSDEGSQGTVMVLFYKDRGELSFTYYPPGSMFARPVGIPYFIIEGAFNLYAPPEWSKYAGIKKAVITPSMADYTPRSTACWFYNLTELETIEGFENLNTGEVTDMSGMFYKCSALRTLDLGGWDTRKVTQMDDMFNGCSLLERLDISDFNTGCVESMASMFSGCSSLENIDVSCFNTQNVTTMNSMFKDCSAAKGIDLSGFETDKVKTMFAMFSGCEYLKELNLGSFNTSNVFDFGYMFARCHSLTKIVVSREGWNMANLHAGAPGMFGECNKLTGGMGTSFDLNHINEEYARIDGGSSNPGYLTEDTNGQYQDNTGQTRAYCVLDGGVLTFYYDNKVNTRPGLRFPVEKNHSAFNMPQWYYKRPRVKRVVFDSSFAAFEPTSTARWFYDFPYLTEVVGAHNLNTSQVTSMSEMFRFNSSLRSVDFSSWDTGKCTDMNCLFCLCTSLADINISNFNTSQVTNMYHMFHACPLTTLDLRSFDTAKVTDMYWMFIDSSVKTIYASDKWSTASVKSSREMFKGCKNLVGGMGTKYDPRHIDHEYAKIDGGMCDPGYLTGEYQSGEPEAYALLEDSTLTFYYDWNRGCREGETFDIPDHLGKFEIGFFSSPEKIGWSGKYFVKAVIDESFSNYYPKYTFYWFANRNLREIDNIEYLRTDSVIDMSHMFSDSNIENLDLSHFNTGNVEYMYEMFTSCGYKTLDLSSFKTSKVKLMTSMFNGCSQLEDVNVSSFTAESLENTSFMFGHCQSLKKVIFRNFNTEKVTNMSSMFEDCISLEEVDVSSFNTVNVESMRWMFSNCQSIRELNLSSFYTPRVNTMERMFFSCESLESLDIRNFDTSKTESTAEMFFCCKSLEALDISSFRTTSLKNLTGMFHGCSSLKSLDLSHFKTDQLQYANELFYDCKLLSEIDLSGFVTKNVTSMMYMFHNCESLKTIFVSDSWSNENVIWGGENLNNDNEMYYYMFLGCKSLIGGQGTVFSSSHTGLDYAHIDGGPSNPGYFTYKEYVAPVGINAPAVLQHESEEGVWYTPQGIRVAAPSKGLYIRRGKKIYIK